MSCFNFVRINNFDKSIFEDLFNILEKNMKVIGFNPTEEDKKIWLFNIEKELKNENLYFYLIVYKEEFCGFIEIVDLNNRLIISEIQINDKMKGTRLILHIIKFIYNNLSFLNYDKVYFNINKNNIISNKTFKHLGAEITLEKEKTIQYEIKRIDVEKYLKSLIKN